jgi:hypothetical protein
LVGKKGSLQNNDHDQQQLLDSNNQDEITNFSILENEDNMSIVEEPNNVDNIDHIVSDFTTFHINHHRT